MFDKSGSSSLLHSLTQQMFVSFKVMANVLSVTLMSGLVHSFVFVMNATMGLTKGAVSFAEVLEYLMPTTAKSAPSRRKT